jgi:hypothetical protein
MVQQEFPEMALKFVINILKVPRLDLKNKCSRPGVLNVASRRIIPNLKFRRFVHEIWLLFKVWIRQQIFNSQKVLLRLKKFEKQIILHGKNLFKFLKCSECY